MRKMGADVAWKKITERERVGIEKDARINKQG